MTWTELDWHVLDRLRERFLQGPAASGPYWESAEDLANYDFTYGERIGWKWDHVLRELRLRGWSPTRTRGGGRDKIAVLDWACGSGIAARRVVSFFGAENFESLTVWDHSPLACDFAAEAARHAFPSLPVSEATPGLLASETPVGLLLISHALNELTPEALASLRALLRRADAILWVEPGTHEVSRKLGTFRDELRYAFRVVAPCTHELGCPMFAPGNERHWCHFFAPPPAEIYADSNWVKFGQRAGIDLRSLPYAFIALERTRPETANSPMIDPAVSRVIGRVEHFKPYARLLNCDAQGLLELELPKRADPTLFKQLERTKAPLVYRWQRDGDKITGGEPFAAAAATD
jgi:hypothetical protein